MERKGDILYNLIDSETGQWETYEKVTTLPDGTAINDTNILPFVPVYRKLGSEYFRKSAINTRSVRLFELGATGDGVTDETNIISTAANHFDDLVINKGDHKVNTTVNISSSVRIIGDKGARIVKGGTENIIFISPPEQVVGNCQAVTAGDSTVTIPGASFETDEFVGCWLWLTSALSRKVISNTSDTLTLDYPAGIDVDPGTQVSIYRPIEGVEINGIEMFADPDNPGAANIIIQYVKNLVVKNVKSINSGGNGLTIRHSDNVLVEDYYGENVNFGLFCYNLNGVRVVRPRVKGWHSTYGVQLKDCRDGSIIDGDNDGQGVGTVAFNIKCSGLHPSKNLSIVNCWGRGVTGRSHYAHTTDPEGDVFHAENFQIIGGGARDCSTGLTVQDTPGRGFNSINIVGFQAINTSQTGINILADNVSLSDFVVTNAGRRSLFVSGSGCNITNGLTINGNRLESDYAVRIDGGSHNIIDGLTVIHTVPESLTNGCVNEVAGTADYNTIKDVRLIDSLGTVSGFISTSGANSSSISLLRNIPSTVSEATYGDYYLTRHNIYQALEITATTVNLRRSRAWWKNITSNLVLNLAQMADGRFAEISIRNTDTNPHTVTITGVQFPDGATNEIPAGGRAHISLQQINGVMDASIVIYS